MRTVDFIVVVLAFTQLMSFGAVSSFGAVVCVESDGRAELEERGCDCTSSTATASSREDNCEQCIDIPIENTPDGLTVRFVSKVRTEPNKLALAEVSYSIPPLTNSLAITGRIMHSNLQDSVSARLVPLRI
jgi:hypothetical protein